MNCLSQRDMRGLKNSFLAFCLTSMVPSNFTIYTQGKFAFCIFQVVNFASNFVLYCVLNVHFRDTVKRVLCCQEIKQDQYKHSVQTTTVVNISSSENETGV